ncbi:uncharacterized protein A4U43_C02F3300 [Asparagus officinalis]|uniref:Exocyst subunit Exo70 family protein n=1 Tax=Asparagus officinalis TaxID=4686 RepID=A0A5P1FKK3_ASPOF|nr:uncharacterized protein A4U43_C02F3300 [Asparagus officinalis]
MRSGGRSRRPSLSPFAFLFPHEPRFLCGSDPCSKNLPPDSRSRLRAILRGASGDPASRVLADGSRPDRSPQSGSFKIVDMYETLRDLIPEADPLLADQLYSIYRSLGSTVKGIFTELENLIRRDPAKSPVPGGNLHPITRYVMNYLRTACVSRRTLEQVMEEEELDNPSSDLDRPSSSLFKVGNVRLKYRVEDVEGMIGELFGGSGRR